jgi:UDP-N-acetyl-D-mannosaminuronate dehydrogenase
LEENIVVVVGLGEVGKPLFDLASERHAVIGLDISPSREQIDRVDYLHICYPFHIADFIGETARYIDLFKPGLTIINSTVAVGTTRTIAERTGSAVVHSPVRGKHTRMLQELRAYTKFVGAVDARSARRAAEHFESMGMKTKVLPTPEATELAKLTETTYFGLLIAWAQEVERYCDRVCESYDDVVSFYDEIQFLPPVRYSPGIIGGHCVMPNIGILQRLGDSPLLNAIATSNESKTKREVSIGKFAAREPGTRQAVVPAR